ncbi:MAG: hypothetical protein K2X47_14410, partial [Bdellovibrionales bacterium]|nr:hypothetical protein [Bdellovibrionales bacterium]
AKVDRAGDTMTGNLAMGANRITGVADPSAAQEAATKAYVDSQNSGKISGTLTATRIPFASGATTLSDSPNFTYTSATGAMTLGGSAPSITSNDALTISAGGTNKNVVLTPSGTGYTLLNGNVGIGTMSPGSALDVFGNLRLNQSADNVATGINFSANGGIQNRWQVLYRPDSSKELQFNNDSAGPVLTLNYNGNVGVGTSTPSARLEIKGSTADTTAYGLNVTDSAGTTTLTVRNDGNTYIGNDMYFNGSNATLFVANTSASKTLNLTSADGVNSTSAISSIINNDVTAGQSQGLLIKAGNGATDYPLKVQTRGAVDLLTVRADGNVGIGATAPASRLHVAAAPTASANIGLVSLGSAPFDGSTSGFFTGHASGTLLAANAASGFAGDLIHMQIAGVQKFKVDKDGVIYGDGSQLSNLASASIPTNLRTRSLGYVFDGGGSALSSGRKAYYAVPFSCTITAWTMTVDAGTATVDVWKRAVSGGAIPTVAHTITASAVPAISSGTHIRSTTLTGWTTSVAANDILGFHLSAVSTATSVSLVLECIQ